MNPFLSGELQILATQIWKLLAYRHSRQFLMFNVKESKIPSQCFVPPNTVKTSPNKEVLFHVFYSIRGAKQWFGTFNSLTPDIPNCLL